MSVHLMRDQRELSADPTSLAGRSFWGGSAAVQPINSVVGDNPSNDNLFILGFVSTLQSLNVITDAAEKAKFQPAWLFTKNLKTGPEATWLQYWCRFESWIVLHLRESLDSTTYHRFQLSYLETPPHLPCQKSTALTWYAHWWVQ